MQSEPEMIQPNPHFQLPFPPPEYEPNPDPMPHDLLRRVLLGISAVALAVAGTLTFGLGSALAADTFPGGYLHSAYSMLSFLAETHLMWFVLMITALAHAAYSWQSHQQTTPRQRNTGFWVTGMNTAAVAWLLAANTGLVWLLFVSSAAGLLCGVAAIKNLNRATSRTNMERLFTDAPIGLLTGWYIVLTGSSLGILLTAWGWHLWLPETVWAVLGIIIMTATTSHLCMTERGRISIALGAGAGLAGIMVARLFGDHQSIWVAILAGGCGFVLLLVTENRRYRIKHAEHRAARGLPTEFDQA